MAHAAPTRLVASIGLVFVVIVLVSNVVVLPPPPATGASAADLARFVASNGFRAIRPPGSDRAGQVRPGSGQSVPGGGDQS